MKRRNFERFSPRILDISAFGTKTDLPPHPGWCFVRTDSKGLADAFCVRATNKGLISNGVGRVKENLLSIFSFWDTPLRRADLPGYGERGTASGLRCCFWFVSTESVEPMFRFIHVVEPTNHLSGPC